MSDPRAATKNGAILQALVEAGSMPVETNQGEKSIAVAIKKLRDKGFDVTTEWGVCYSMTPRERDRLRLSKYYQRAIRMKAHHGGKPVNAVIVQVQDEQYLILQGHADDTGRSINDLATQAITLGIDILIEAET